MNIVIIGGSGYVGSTLARLFLKEGFFNVRILDLIPPSKDIDKIADYYNIDITSKFPSIEAYLQNTDIVYHCAAKLPIEKASLDEYMKVNCDGTKNVIKACINAKVKKLVFISTSAVYAYTPSPIKQNSIRTTGEFYGQSKLEAEQYCEEIRNKGLLDISIVRPRTIVGGDRLGIIYWLFYMIKNNKNVYLIGNGKNKFQLVGVNDLANVLYRISETKCNNVDFNVGTDNFNTLGEDIKSLIQLTGSTSKIKYIPYNVIKLVTPFIEYFTPINRWHYDFLHRDFYFDTATTNNILNYKSSKSNLEMLYESYQNFLNETNESNKSVHKTKIKLGILKLLP